MEYLMNKLRKLDTKEKLEWLEFIMKFIVRVREFLIEKYSGMLRWKESGPEFSI